MRNIFLSLRSSRRFLYQNVVRKILERTRLVPRKSGQRCSRTTTLLSIYQMGNAPQIQQISLLCNGMVHSFIHCVSTVMHTLYQKEGDLLYFAYISKLLCPFAFFLFELGLVC